MKYSHKRFGAELLLLLEENFDIEKISHWATETCKNFSSEMNKDLIEVVQKIASLNFGSAFEMTEEELRQLAIELIEKDRK